MLLLLLLASVLLGLLAPPIKALRGYSGSLPECYNRRVLLVDFLIPDLFQSVTTEESYSSTFYKQSEMAHPLLFLFSFNFFPNVQPGGSHSW